MPATLVPIVGMHFRPPAKLVLAGLPAGAHLRLEPEPSNPYDENAIKVLCDPNDMVEGYLAEITDQLEDYGRTPEELLKETDLHLGYVARTETHKCQGILGGVLAFAGDGKPLCELDDPLRDAEHLGDEPIMCDVCGENEVELEGDACEECLDQE